MIMKQCLAMDPEQWTMWDALSPVVTLLLAENSRRPVLRLQLKFWQFTTRWMKYLAVHSHCRFILCCESESALKMLSNADLHHTFATDMLIPFHSLICWNFDILFCWVPGHVGIAGNERADNAARNSTAFVQQPFPVNDIKLRNPCSRSGRSTGIYRRITNFMLFNLFCQYRRALAIVSWTSFYVDSESATRVGHIDAFWKMLHLAATFLTIVYHLYIF